MVISVPIAVSLLGRLQDSHCCFDGHSFILILNLQNVVTSSRASACVKYGEI